MQALRNSQTRGIGATWADVTLHDGTVQESAGAEPPTSLRDLAEAVERRLSPAGVTYAIRFIPPTDVSWWSLAVDFEDGSVDDLYAARQGSRIAVVPNCQEDVSVGLAAEYVAMCADLLTESAWWQMVRDEQQSERDARKTQRRERWRARLGLSR